MSANTTLMPQYIGVKVVRAIPMDENAFKESKGYEKVENSREGYHVTYEGGYGSWSPKDAFDEAYREVSEGNMTFGLALEAMNKGMKVSRKGWNNIDISLEVQIPDENSKMTKPYIYMNKGNDKFPCDLSCESILAEDWFVIENKD